MFYVFRDFVLSNSSISTPIKLIDAILQDNFYIFHLNRDFVALSFIYFLDCYQFQI